MKRNTWKKALLVGVAGLLLVPLAAACGGSDEEGGSTVKPGATATKAAGDNGGNGGGEVREIEVVMTDNIFTPKEIKVPVNTTIKFTVPNKGTAIHNMHIMSKAAEGKDFSSDALVNAGATSTFEARFTKKGVIDFQCDYHLPEMVGKIVVE